MKKQLQVLLAVLLIASLALAACSGGEAPSTGGDGNGGNGGGGSEINQIAIASGADPITLDPRKTWVGPGYSINAHIFEPLVFRSEKDGEIKIEGVLAEEIENVDELTWKFTLKEGVKFHNGEPLTAEAVKFTFESIMDPQFNTPLKTWLTDVDTITTEGDLVVYIKTKYPTRGLLSSIAQVPIVEPKAVEELGDDFNIKPVGTGPYKVVKYTAGNEVLVERFEDYWGEPGKPDRIQFRIMPENAVRLAALQRGDVVLAEAIPPDKLDTVQNDPELDVVFTETLRVDFLVLELSRPWLDNQKFREALSLAIDRQSLVDNILGGTTIAASSVSPPGTIGFNDDLPVYEYNLEKAKQLLEEVGYDGTAIKMGAPIGRYAMDKQIGEAVAGMLQEAGVNIEFEALEWSSYYPKTREDVYDIWFIGQTDFTINPNKHWDSLYYSANSENSYSNPEMDAIMDEAIQTLDDAAAAELYKRGQAILYEEKPTLPLYYEPQLIGVRKGVEGFAPRLDEYVIIRDVTVSE